MRIHVHDFSGHPFQAQLSRRLAARGHRVTHGHCAQYVSGHGRLARVDGDPVGLEFRALSAPVPLERYSPRGRIRFERAYGAALGVALVEERPDVTVLCNVPLFAQAATADIMTAAGLPWVFWHQDVYSAGVAAEAGRKLPAPAARVAGAYAVRTEKDLVRRASAVIAIGDPFVTRYRQWGLRTDHVAVIPNWAPVDEITPRDRENGWWPLPDAGLRLLYAGTLGRKHNPLLLLELADALAAADIDAGVVVASEGAGADVLREHLGTAGRPDVRLAPFQPAEVLPDMLGSADVLVAQLEPDAALFSIPSKVLSYLAAGRPVLVFAPTDNPCATDVRASGGIVVDPTATGVREAVDWLAGLRRDDADEIGRRARAIACEKFEIDGITDRFEQVLTRAARSVTAAAS